MHFGDYESISRSRGDMEEEQASLQAAQGGSEQKCGNAKCIMCTTLDRFTCLCFPLCLACIEMKILESWEKIWSYTLAGDREGRSSRSGEGRRLEKRWLFKRSFPQSSTHLLICNSKSWHFLSVFGGAVGQKLDILVLFHRFMSFFTYFLNYSTIFNWLNGFFFKFAWG